MLTEISLLEAGLSLTLVALAIGLSLWRRVGVEKSILWAAIRAAVQLLAVGVVFRLIFESAGAPLWAWLWVIGMVVIAAVTVRHRAPAIPHLWAIAFGAVGGGTAVTLALVFGLGIMEQEPVALVVIAGITIGNTMPSTVLAVDQAAGYLRDMRGQIEAMLALGFGSRDATRFLVSETSRTSLIPQIERTKVVGLIALPGAMTGLLLAGVDPIDAVLVQLVIMYLILGSVSVAVIVVTSAVASLSLTKDLRLAAWSASS